MVKSPLGLSDMARMSPQSRMLPLGSRSSSSDRVLFQLYASLHQRRALTDLRHRLSGQVR